jgi:hypothetical protein
MVLDILGLSHQYGLLDLVYEISEYLKVVFRD